MIASAPEVPHEEVSHGEVSHGEVPHEPPVAPHEPPEVPHEPPVAPSSAPEAPHDPSGGAMVELARRVAGASGAEAVAVFAQSDGGRLQALAVSRRPDAGDRWPTRALADAADRARATAGPLAAGPAASDASEAGPGLSTALVALPDGPAADGPAADGPDADGADADGAGVAVVVGVLGEPVGVLVVVGASGPADPGALRRAGEQVGTALALRQLEQVERRHRLGLAHARRHLALLVRAGDALAGAVTDLAPALRALGEVVVPMFADWFAVDLLPDTAADADAGPPERLVAGGEVASAGGASPHRHPDGDRLVADVVHSGRSEMVVRRPPDGGDHLPGPELGAARPAGAAESMLVVPVRVRGAVVGAASFVTGAGRRGYRLSDLRVAEDLADRIGVTVDRVRLWHARQRAALVAEANQRRLHAVVDASPLAIVELDGAASPRWWNPAAQRLLGWVTPPGLGGDPGTAPPAAVTSSPTADALRPLWARACAGDPVAGELVRAPGADGGTAHLSVSGALLRGAEGEPAGALAIIEDVTERQRMIERVNQAERLEAMARLAGSVAHDFNNLLTVVLGSCEVLLARMDERDPLAEEVRAIRTAGQRAADLTSQLLSIGQRRALQPVEVDPDAVLAAMQGVLSRVVGDDVVVEQQVLGSPVRILVEPAELERAVLNLALNARDAMPDGGRLTLGSRVRPGGPGDPALVDVWVADTGTGMDAHTAAHCFEPFFTTKPRGSGTGLGLAGVHAFVAAAGGTAAVDSAPGAGTTFTMTFPAAAPGGAARRVAGDGAAAAVTVAGTGGGGSGDDGVEDEAVVLVVDDDPTVRRVVVQALVRQGLLVLEAASADEALDAVAAATDRLALLITDVSMPGMGGRELAARLVASSPELPVLYMTGDEAAADLAAGADVVRKPFTAEELVARVRRALRTAAC